MRQIYFPISGRELIMPKMFEEEQLEVTKKNLIFLKILLIFFYRKF
jgi:hypothetical protein